MYQSAFANTSGGDLVPPSRARMAARAAAEEIMFAQATNDAEETLQAKTKELFFTRLGGDLMPPSRPIRSNPQALCGVSVVVANA